MIPEGEVIPLSHDGRAEYVVVRGHVTEAEFVQALAAWGEDRRRHGATEHRYGRWLPAQPDADYSLLGFLFSKAGPGAFAVTCAWLATSA